MTKPIEQLDRVSFSQGRKLNVGNYESIDIHVSYSTDVSSEESPEEAIQRAAKVVKSDLLARVKKIKVKRDR